MKNIVNILILASMISWQAQADTYSSLSLKKLLPQYVTWAKEINKEGMRIGEPLDTGGLSLAREIGIKSAGKIRIIYVDVIPYPYENLALKVMGESLGLIGAGIINNAQVFGYAIYVRKGYDLDRPRMAHELVHVLQIERENLSKLVTQHITDLSKYSYENAPLEAEAFKANKKYQVK